MTARHVTQVVQAQLASDGAGVKLRRSIGGHALPNLDPFLMLDAFGTDDPNDYLAGFPAHPHRGFETVTYMLAGSMEHKDSVGNTGHLVAGSVQWMTAGRGIIHSEMPRQQEGRMAGFQLWVNLPRAKKMTAPRYQDIPPGDIPVVNPAPGVQLKVIAGEAGGVSGPVGGVDVAPVMVDVALEADVAWSLDLPEGHAGFAYVFEGDALVGADTPVPMHHLAVLSPGGSLALRGGQAGARVLVVAGRPLREPIVQYGPFVMSTRAEIAQAIEDYQAGRMGG